MPRVYRPWKRSYRRVPDTLQTNIETTGGQPVRVAGVRVVPRSQIRQGHLAPIGVQFTGDQLVIQSTPIVPPRENGLWARRNLDGWEIVRRDLPKISRSYSFESPNFGDWSRGSHTIDWSREIYQRDVISPRNAAISVFHEGAAPNEDSEILRFELDDIFDKADPDFQRQILLGINLLQESTGCTGIFAIDATPEEILSHRFVNWVIFPPGTTDETYIRAFHRFPRISEETQRLILARRTFLENLNPRELVFGQSFGENSYFGAIFRDDLVVFENIALGNAIYIMFDDWQSLSRLSRTELLKNYNNYKRIYHTGDWQYRLRSTINRLR